MHGGSFLPPYVPSLPQDVLGEQDRTSHVSPLLSQRREPPYQGRTYPRGRHCAEPAFDHLPVGGHAVDARIVDTQPVPAHLGDAGADEGRHTTVVVVDVAGALSCAREAFPLLARSDKTWPAYDTLSLIAALGGRIEKAAMLQGLSDAAYATAGLTVREPQRGAHSCGRRRDLA